MQASLALAAGALGLVVFARTHDVRWLVGALLMLSMLPYTFIVVMPANRRLEAMNVETDDKHVRPEVERWGHLHAGRTVLGLVAVLIYLWATL